MKKFKVDNTVKFVVALFFVGLMTGIVYYMATRPDMGVYIESFKESLNGHQNTFLPSFISFSVIFVLSISIIGLPGVCFYIFYEGLSIGFSLALFSGVYSLSGTGFYLLFLLVCKLLFEVLLLFFSITSIKYGIRFIEAIVNKNKEVLTRSIVIHFYRFIIVLGIGLVNSVFIFFLGNVITKLFIGLIS